MNKNIAWILAILFSSAGLGAWYLGRDTQTDDQALIAPDTAAQSATPQAISPDATTPQATSAQSPAPVATSSSLAQADSSDKSDTETQQPSDTNAADANQANPDTGDMTDDPTTTAPVLETARIDADGAVVIAGRSDAGAQVDILVDGVVLETVMADRAGNFVALFDLPQSKVARSLTLRVGSGADVVYAAQDIIIAPSQIKAVQAIPETAATAQISASDINSELATEQKDRQTAVTSLSDVSEQAANLSANTDDTSATTDTVASDAGQADDTSASQQVDQTAADAVLSTDDMANVPEIAQDDASVVTATYQVMENLIENPQVVVDTKATQPQTRLSTSDESVSDPVVEQSAPVTSRDASDTQSAQMDPAPKPDTGTTDQSPTPPQPNKPTVFAADASGIKVLQGGETLPTDQIVMDAISYDASGGVILSGRGQAGAVLQFYLDNALTQTAQIDAQGFWTQDMSNIAPGVYTLRLDQLDDAGQVTARFETPFKREDRTALAAAAAQVAQQAADATPSTQDQTTDITSDPADTQPSAPAPVQAITVQPGNTLWGISQARYGQGILYVRVFDANREKIRDPDLIYPGQVFVLPSQAQ